MKITQPTWGEMHSKQLFHWVGKSRVTSVRPMLNFQKSTTHEHTSLMVVMHNIFQPCGSSPWLWNYVNHIPWPTRTIKIILLLFVHSEWTWKFGWNYTPHSAHALLFILGISEWNIIHLENLRMKHVHPNIIPFNYYPWQTPSLKIPTIFTVFIIRTSVRFFLFSKFLSMKTRKWKPMSKAKYGMKHNRAVE